MKHWDEMSPRWHDDYERGRPGYPLEAISLAGLPASAAVLELGAGTGKLTRLLLSRFASVVAVEPDPAMRRCFSAVCSGGALIGGVAEQLPFADSSVDGVFVAEAFHWFAHERSLTEIARVLRPGGALALLWNRPAGPVEPPITDVEELLAPLWPADVGRPLDLDPSRFPHARDWPRAFIGSPFEPLQEAHIPNPQVVDREGVVAFFGSMGWIGELPDRELQLLLGEISARLSADSYLLPFETHLHWTRLAAPTTSG